MSFEVSNPWTWARFGPRRDGPSPAVFLDRDGVIMDDPGFLSDPSQVALLAGSAAAVARLNVLEVPVVVVSNQSGIGRGYFGWPEFEGVQAELERRIAETGARLDAMLACGHYGEPAHPWRKPGPGMLLAAAEAMNLDLTRSWMAGDRASDIDAAAAAGLRGALLVETGLGRETLQTLDAEGLGFAERWPGFEVRLAADLATAVEMLAALGAEGPLRRTRGLSD